MTVEPREDSTAPSTATDPGLRADAQRNRERIIDAAREVFAEQGLDASLNEVARRAGSGWRPYSAGSPPART